MGGENAGKAAKSLSLSGRAMVERLVGDRTLRHRASNT
jgi:hypothetical protein